MDPYVVLDLPPDSDDEMIRRRYLELVRRHSPERDPKRFAEIRQAYEQLKDATTRLKQRLFQPGKPDALDVIIEEIQCQSSRRRLTLQQILNAIPEG